MPADTSRAVFLSYASQDAEAARRICEALRSGGVEVWIDADGGLEHGDEWDAKIRRQIKECVLFIPVISASTQAREEGYFRIEWDLAAERARGIASGVPFILPVVIDDTREPDALVPDRFRAVQWTRLRNGEVPSEVQHRFLKLWSHRTGVLKHEADVGRGRRTPPGSETAAFGDAALPRKRSPVWLAGGALALAVAAVVAWKFWPHAPEAVPRDPELQRAAALFDFNSPDSTAEGYALAEDILKTVLAKRPADADAVILYAWLNDLFIIRGFDVSDGRRTLARQYAERAARLAPLNADALAAQGVFCGMGYSSDDWARAEQLLKQAIAINPRDPRYYRMLGFALVDQKKNDGAMRNAQRALDLFPDNALVHYDFGLVQLYIGEAGAAEKAFRDTLALTPPSSLLYGGLHADLASFAAFAHADLAGMKSWLDRMPVQFRDQDREAMPLFFYALASGETDRALATLRQFPGAWLRNYGETPKGLIAGDLLVLQGKTEQARGEFEAAQVEVAQARAKEPDKIRYRQLEVWTRLRLGRLAEARAALPGVIEATSRFDPLYLSEYWYGPLAASLVLGDKESALNYLRKAATTAGWRRYFRNLIQIDPRVKDWRNDPEITALLSDPAKSSAVPVGAADAQSVAVLAFANFGGDRENEYFSDGITEELLNVLAKVPGLRVAARTSAFYFKDKNVPIPEIAQKLNVAYVVEGSVQKSGTRVKITAQLIKAADGFHVWSDTFTRELKDVFAMQDEIAGLIAKQLQLSLGDALHVVKAVNPEAHQLVLEGRYFWLLRTDDGFARAEQAYTKALQIDPEFAEAHAGLANVCAIRGWYSYLAGGQPDVDFTRAREEAQVALRLDPSLAEAHAALGAVAYNEWKFPEAEQAFQTALRLNPNYSFAHHWRAHLLMSQGRVEESVDELERATQLDPLQFITLVISATHLSFAGRYAEALVRNERALALRPDVFIPAYGNQAVYLLALGRKEEAVAAARVVTRDITIQPRWWEDADVIYVLRATGHAHEAIAHGEKILATLPPDSSVRADVLAAMGRTDEAIEQLGRTRPRPSECSAIFCGETWAAIRQQPKFAEVLAKLGLLDSYRATQAELKKLGIGLEAKK